MILEFQCWHNKQGYIKTFSCQIFSILANIICPSLITLQPNCIRFVNLLNFTVKDYTKILAKVLFCVFWVECCTAFCLLYCFLSNISYFRYTMTAPREQDSIIALFRWQRVAAGHKCDPIDIKSVDWPLECKLFWILPV